MVGKGVACRGELTRMRDVGTSLCTGVERTDVSPKLTFFRVVAFVSLEALLPNSGGGAADAFDSFAEGAASKVNFELLLGADDSAVLFGPN